MEQDEATETKRVLSIKVQETIGVNAFAMLPEEVFLGVTIKGEAQVLLPQVPSVRD